MRQFIQLFFLGALLLMFSASKGQVIDNIKTGSTSSRGTSSSSSSSSSSSGTNSLDGGGGGGDFLTECCTDVACDLACSLVGVILDGGFEKNMQTIERKKDEVPRIASIDIEGQGSLVPDNYFIGQPRLKLHGGMFSTDFRYFFMVEDRLNGVDNYGTLDWQVIKMNVINVPVNTTGFGVGFMHETFSEGGTYPEFTMYSDFYIAQKFRIALEGRLAVTDVRARAEGNGSIRYTIWNNDHLEWHGFIGGNYAEFYESVDVWSVNLGTSLRIQ